MKPLHTWLYVGGIILILATTCWIFLHPTSPSLAATSNTTASPREQAPIASSQLAASATGNASPVFQYNAQGLLQKILYPDGTSYLYIYDAHGDKISETGRTGKTWTYRYDEHQHVKSMVNPDGGLIAVPADQ